MRWLIISHEHNAIVKQCHDLLQVAGQIAVYVEHQGSKSLEKIKEKINEHKPDRVIVISNEEIIENNSPLDKTLTDQLLIPLYVCQATMDSYTSIRVLLLTFTNEISPINIIQNATNQLTGIYPHILNARLITPIIDEELNEQILLKKLKSLWGTNPEKSHHITILSDVLPILLALIHDGKTNGQVDVCNKGTISLDWFDQLLSKQTEIPVSQLIDTENLTDHFEDLNNQVISPGTRHLYHASFALPNASKSLELYFQQKSIQLDLNAPRVLLVTGGCGFIGSTFINHWLETYPNDRVLNIDRLDSVSNTKNVSNSQSPNYSLIIADINNTDIVLHLMRQYHVTHIVHFAVQAHLDSSFGNSITFTESNVYGTHSVLEASRIYGQIQKFIHLSTDEVYGETPMGSYQETSLLNPINPYAATVAAAEFLVKSYGESFKLSYCIIRLSNVYGPRQHFSKVIPTFINNLFHGQKLQIHGDGKQIRHYIYIDDVINAIEIIFHKGKSKMIYNIGTENGFQLLDIAEKLVAKIQPEKNLQDIITYVKGRSFTDKRYSTTNGAVKTLGWKARVSFDEGLEKTIQWYQKNQDYWIKSNDTISPISDKLISASLSGRFI